MWWRAVLVVTAACGRYDFGEIAGPGGTDARASDGRVGDGSPGDDAAPTSDASPDAPVSCAWGAPVRVANVNTADEDWEPAISPDGLTLVFARQAGTGGPHLYLSHRNQVTAPFSAPVNVLASAANEAGPAWSSDGRLLYFSSDRSVAMFPRLYTVVFDPGSVTFGAASEVLSIVSDLVGPTVSATDLELFYNDSSLMSAMRWATRSDAAGSWTDLGVIAELTSGKGDGWPSLSPDGLTIYFESARDSMLGFIYGATRPAIGGTWGNIAKVAELDGGTADGDPDFSADGLAIYFASDRPGGAGGNDIYLATRACL